MYTQELDVTGFDDYAHHERVLRCVDEARGLRAFIAIHDRTLGPALGGCRMWPYPTEQDAIKDVLRLSRGMTYKSAVAGLPLGGGKAVIMGNPATDKSQALMEAMGEFVDSLSGAFITAEDSGTGVEDLAQMATRTPYVTGIHKKRLSDGSEASGDPSPSTAIGVLKGIEAAARYRWQVDSLAGLTVAIQGVGHVGRYLALLLSRAGAEVILSDVSEARIASALQQCNARVVDSAEIHKQAADIFAPCALGGVVSVESLAEIRAPVIAGAANNQLATPSAGYALFKQGKLYAPDYVINAGGIIDIYYARTGYDHKAVMAHLDGIGHTLDEIFDMAKRRGEPTHVMADRLAEMRLHRGRVSEVA